MIPLITDNLNYLSTNNTFCKYKINSLGNITSTNKVFKQLFNYSNEDVLNKYHGFLRHPKMPISIIEHISNRINDGKSCYAVIMNKTRNNKAFWTLSFFKPFAEDNNLQPSTLIIKTLLNKNEVGKLEKLYRILKTIEQHKGIEISDKYLKGFLEYKKMNCEEFVENCIKKSYKIFKKEIDKLEEATSQIDLINVNKKDLNIIHEFNSIIKQVDLL